MTNNYKGRIIYNAVTNNDQRTHVNASIAAALTLIFSAFGIDICASATQYVQFTPIGYDYKRRRYDSIRGVCFNLYVNVSGSVVMQLTSTAFYVKRNDKVNR